MKIPFTMFAAFVMSSLAITSMGAQRHPMEPRVPEEQLAEARALRSPLADSAEAIERGKGLYHGKGTCFTCHGPTGQGDGPAAMGLNPAPRNFHHRGFWRHRSEGEIFWVIKHGVAGTGMVGFGSVLTDDEIWSIIQYERSFAGGRGPRQGMDREGMGPEGDRSHRGGRGGMGRRHGGPPGEEEGDDRECCREP